MRVKIAIAFLICVQICEGYMSYLSSQNIHKTMQHDLEIMEIILDKMLLQEDRGFSFIHKGANGFYLDDYGVLFEVPYTADRLLDDRWIHDDQNNDVLIMLNTHEKSPQAIKNYNKSSQIKDKSKSADENYIIKIDEEIEKIKNTVTRFLGDYASAINGLKPEQSVTVVVDFNGSFFLMDMLQQDCIKKLIAKSQKKDILDFRKGHLSFDEFKNKIKFETHVQNQSTIDADIEILVEIFESSLGKNNNREEYLSAHRVKGFYVNGYGVIFMLTTSMEPNFLQIITKKSGDNQENNYSFQTVWSSENNDDVINDKINALQDEIINLMSRFGHTMRHLDKNEWLEVALNIDPRTMAKDYSKVIMKIKKGEIERLNQQQIDQNAFKKNVRIIKY